MTPFSGDLGHAFDSMVSPAHELHEVTPFELANHDKSYEHCIWSSHRAGSQTETSGTRALWTGSKRFTKIFFPVLKASCMLRKGVYCFSCLLFWWYRHNSVCFISSSPFFLSPSIPLSYFSSYSSSHFFSTFPPLYSIILLIKGFLCFLNFFLFLFLIFLL